MFLTLGTRTVPNAYDIFIKIMYLPVYGVLEIRQALVFAYYDS